MTHEVTLIFIVTKLLFKLVTCWKDIYIYIYHPYFYSNQIIVQTGHMLEGYIYIYISPLFL